MRRRQRSGNESAGPTSIKPGIAARAFIENRAPSNMSCSGVGTHLKAGAPARRESGEGEVPIRRKVLEQIFGRALPLFGGYKSTISRFGERFCNGQYSLASLSLAVLPLAVPLVPSHL